MWKQSVWTSTISSHLASLHLKQGGLLTLAGAKAALSGTGGKSYICVYQCRHNDQVHSTLSCQGRWRADVMEGLLSRCLCCPTC